MGSKVRLGKEEKREREEGERQRRDIGSDEDSGSKDRKKNRSDSCFSRLRPENFVLLRKTIVSFNKTVV